MLTKFSVWGSRAFPGYIELDLSSPRDYQFNADCVRDGVVRHALLIGRNASGKTSLGLALMDIFENFQTPSPLDRDLEDDPLYLSADNGSGFARFRYEFRFGKSEVIYEYEKTALSSLSGERLFVDGSLVFDYDNEGRVMRHSDLASIGAEGLNWAYADGYLSVLSYFVNSVPRSRLGILKEIRDFAEGLQGWGSAELNTPEKLSKMLFRVINKDKLGDLELFLRRFGVAEHLVIHKEPDGRRAVYSHHFNHDIPFAEACSSGTRTLLGLYQLFEMTSSISLVFLDEFDAYCHYEAAEELLRYLSEKGECQTIATTHNISLVKNESMRPDCVFQIDPVKGIKSLADSTDRELRLGNNVEKLLRSGEFEL